VGGILRTVAPHLEKLRADEAAFVALDSAPAAMARPFQMIELILSNEYISGGAKAKCWRRWIRVFAAGVLTRHQEAAPLLLSKTNAPHRAGRSVATGA
jgi:hypothetical protein